MRHLWTVHDRKSGKTVTGRVHILEAAKEKALEAAASIGSHCDICVLTDRGTEYSYEPKLRHGSGDRMGWRRVPR